MKLRIITTLAALFLLGGASGYLAGQSPGPAPKTPAPAAPLPRDPRLDHVFGFWKERLQLSPAQIAAMQPTLAASEEKMRAIHAETAEKIRALLRENAAALRTCLTPEQSAEFERLTRQMIFKQGAH